MSQATPVDLGQEIRISADSHVVEPPDLWEKRLPLSLRERAPRFGEPLMAEEGHRAGAWDIGQHLKDMDTEGVAAQVLYPTLANEMYRTLDSRLVEACASVYNQWVAELCQEAPDRLWGQAIVPLWEINLAVQELERSRKVGLKGATIWIAPPPQLPFGSDHYEAFWAAAQDLEMPISMHNGAGYAPHQTVSLLAEGGLERHQFNAYGYQLAAMDALTRIIVSGVLERYPGLKIVVAEAGVGCLPFWLQELDDAYQMHVDQPLPFFPSEYFYRQVYATLVDDPLAGHVLSGWGKENFMWSDNYPLRKGTWPNSQEVISRTLGQLPHSVRAKVLCQNVARVYGMLAPGEKAGPAGASEPA